MENHLRSILRNGSATRSLETKIRCLKERSISPGIRTFEGSGMRILDIVTQRGEAMRREEKIVHAVFAANDIRGFYEWSVCIVYIENDLWLAYFGDAVAFQFLEDERDRATRFSGVAAVSPATNAISIALVDDVEFSIDVFEGRWVDCTAVLVWTGERLV